MRISINTRMFTRHFLLSLLCARYLHPSVWFHAFAISLSFYLSLTPRLVLYLFLTHLVIHIVLSRLVSRVTCASFFRYATAIPTVRFTKRISMSASENMQKKSKMESLNLFTSAHIFGVFLISCKWSVFFLFYSSFFFYQKK